MNELTLQNLGLNRNEAKVYLALLHLSQATAAELVRKVGVHRNIVYDNLEKLIEKGIVTFIIEGNKRKFIAQDPQSVVEYLETKRDQIESNIEQAKSLLPQISKILEQTPHKQEASIFYGIKGVKKVLSMILDTKAYWGIGVTNASVTLLGDAYWRNFNLKIKDRNIKEHLLLNSTFKQTVGITKSKHRKSRTLLHQFDQVTEIMLFDAKAAIFVYSTTPLVFLIDDENVFRSFQKQFSLLWDLSV